MFLKPISFRAAKTYKTELTLSQTKNCKSLQTTILNLMKWQKENTGKMRNCLLQAISPFPTVFSKDSRHVKTRACLGKG